jgi:hypothetical protein
MEFTKKTPCKNCPYRKDAPLALWSIKEFIDLLKNERSQFGAVYGCHKKDGCVCVGWLMNQDENRMPSIALRFMLSKQGITRKYLDALKCKSERFKTIEEMIVANYPKLKSFIARLKNNNNHGR